MIDWLHDILRIRAWIDDPRGRMLDKLGGPGADEVNAWGAVWAIALGALVVGGLAVAIPVLLEPGDPMLGTDSFSARVEQGEPGTARRDRFVAGLTGGALLGFAILAVRLYSAPRQERPPRPDELR